MVLNHFTHALSYYTKIFHKTILSTMFVISKKKNLVNGLVNVGGVSPKITSTAFYFLLLAQFTVFLNSLSLYGCVNASCKFRLYSIIEKGIYNGGKPFFQLHTVYIHLNLRVSPRMKCAEWCVY